MMQIRNSITCKAAIMTLLFAGLSTPTATPAPGRELLAITCLRTAVIIQCHEMMRMESSGISLVVQLLVLWLVLLHKLSVI